MATKLTPKVSVVLPTYNHLAYLPLAIESMLMQTFTDFELIIVNDGSTDGTREYLESLDDPRIRIIHHQKNKGLPNALNTGFSEAQGELLTWVSADNYCAPIFLEALVLALQTYPEAGFAYSSFAYIDKDDNIIGICKDQDMSYHSLLAQNPGNASFMYRRICQEIVGLYDPDLNGVEDWDMWLRIVEKFKYVYIPEILYYYRRHHESISGKHTHEHYYDVCKKLFINAIKRNNIYDLERLYPAISKCKERKIAEFWACIDFGVSLLQSPCKQNEVAFHFLERALSIRLQINDHHVQKTAKIVETVIRSGNLNLLKNFLLSIDKTKIELFQIEERMKLIFPFTLYKTFKQESTDFSIKIKENNRKLSILQRKKQIKDKYLSVIHTVEFYYPHIGGAETVVQKISEKLVKRGHHVEIATTKLPERNFKELNGVIIHEFDISGNLALGVRGKDIQRYKEFLVNRPANIMMNYAAQQWATDLAFDVLKETKDKRINIIAPCGYSALHDAQTIRWPQFTEYFNKILPTIIPLYDAAIYHSSIYKDYEYAQMHGFKNSVVIPNGVDEGEFIQQGKGDFREKYNIKTQFMGLCVANFYKEKGHDRVIEAVRQMNRKDFTMVFIGKEGSELELLREKAKGLNIIFLVDISRGDTVAAFHAADVFILGSYVEACPLVIIEAKASKTPFVSTDVGNVREWKGGIICKPEDLAENANKLLDNESLRKQLAEEGYKEWREKLTWDSIVDKYEELYLKLYKDKENAYLNYRKDSISKRKFFFDDLQKDFRHVPSLINLAEVELENSNYKKARNLLIAALTLDPENNNAKKLLEKIKEN